MAPSLAEMAFKAAAERARMKLLAEQLEREIKADPAACEPQKVLEVLREIQEQEKP